MLRPVQALARPFCNA